MEYVPILVNSDQYSFSILHMLCRGELGDQMKHTAKGTRWRKASQLICDVTWAWNKPLLSEETEIPGVWHLKQLASTTPSPWDSILASMPEKDIMSKVWRWQPTIWKKSTGMWHLSLEHSLLNSEAEGLREGRSSKVERKKLVARWIHLPTLQEIKLPQL